MAVFLFFVVLFLSWTCKSLCYLKTHRRFVTAKHNLSQLYCLLYRAAEGLQPFRECESCTISKYNKNKQNALKYTNFNK